jgi:AcrR family transcriptional regulator
MATNLERAASTRAKVVATARRLFAAHGYEGTSTEAVLEESQVSRGALYYHFANKQALFAAVLEAVEQDITAETGRAGASVADPVEALQLAFDSFLGMASRPEVRQIVLTDAHSVLGWQKWREVEERYGLGRLKGALKIISATGRIREDLVDVYAHILLASLIEVAFLTTRSADPDAAGEGRRAMRELLDRLMGQPMRDYNSSRPL